MTGLVTVLEQAVAVAPGERASATVRVKNTGEIVEGFQVEVVGPTADWATVEPPLLRLFPASADEVRVWFHPPRQTPPAAGPHRFGVRVRTEVNPEWSTVEEGTVTVAPLRSIGADLRPRTSTGKRSGQHRVVVTNHGNVAALVGVTADDPDELLRLRATPAQVHVAPGAEEVVHLEAAVAGRLPHGTSRLPFQVVVSADDEPVATLPGMFAPTVRTSRWPLVAALAMPLLVAGLVLGFLRLTANVQVPVVATLEQGAAAARLQQEGLEVLARVVVHAAPSGTAVGTEPPAGTSLRRGSEVLLQVSDGRGATQDVAVPDVRGIALDDARQVLANEGLANIEVRDAPVQSGRAGQVVAQAPDPGTRVNSSSRVILAVVPDARPTPSPPRTVPPAVTVPRVVGLTAAQARQTLAQAGLRNVTETQVTVGQAQRQLDGQVVEQDPPQGAQVAPDAAVVLTVAVLGGQPTTQPPTQPPTSLNLIASPAGAECGYIPGGHLSGADLLNVFFRMQIEGGTPQETGLVQVRGQSNTGLTASHNAAPSNQAFTASQFALDANAFGRTHTILITVDPDNRIAEASTADNTIRVTVTLPSPRPTQAIDPLPCTVARA
jgi:beta-lactam-binding protein with PASTA domain